MKDVHFSHLIYFVTNQHFHNVVARRVGFQLIQPVFKFREGVTSRDIVNCENKSSTLAQIHVQTYTKLHVVEPNRRKGPRAKILLSFD